MRKLLSILLIIIVFIVSGCSASMSGTVVDAESGEPIENAVVLVEWTRATGIGDKHTSSVTVVEKVTDKEGKFSVSGTLQPFIDPPHLSIYKKGYVCWSSRIIFPDYRNRTDFKWQHGQLFRMEKFKKGYSYDKHESFIMESINSGLNIESKKKIFDSFEWERVLAFQERIGKKGKR